MYRGAADSRLLNQMADVWGPVSATKNCACLGFGTKPALLFQEPALICTKSSIEIRYFQSILFHEVQSVKANIARTLDRVELPSQGSWTPMSHLQEAIK